MNIDQLTDDLARVAAGVELRPGSLVRARAEGRRRRYRRRRAGVAVTAVAAVGVTGVAVHQLSRPGPSVSSTPGTLPGSTAVSPPTSAGVAPVPTIPVTEVDSPFVWRRIDPESAEAVGSSVDPSLRPKDAPLPGIVVSTGPGQEDPRRTLWRSSDGVSWAQVGALPTGATSAATATRGDRVYAVGTMPGPTVDTVGPVRVSISDDAGGSWRGVDLPTANPALEAVADGRPVRTAIGGVAVTDTVGLVLIRQTVDPADVSTMVAELGLDDFAAPTPDGVEVYACDSAPATTMPVVNVTPTAPATTLPVVNVTPTAPIDQPECSGVATPLRVIPFAELGAAGATLEAMIRPQQRLFATTDSRTFAEIPMPTSDSLYDTTIQTLGGEIVLVSHDPGERTPYSFWRTVDGLAWSELPAPPNASGRIGRLGSGFVSLSDITRLGVDIDLDSTGSWRTVDVGALYPAEEMALGAWQMASGVEGVTLAVAVATRNPDFVESAAMRPTPTVGGATATTVSEPYTDQRFEILHSADGANWSRESVAELAGVDASEVSTVTRIQSTPGGGVVVAVNLRAPDDELPHQLVLVGTPKG